MMIRTLSTPAELVTYDAAIHQHPQGNLWQSLTWKTYQESLGREVRLYVLENNTKGIEGTALVVIDRTIGGYSTWDIPRGPLFSDQWLVASDQYVSFLKKIIDDAKLSKCLALYYSPTTTLPTIHYPLTTSLRHIQPEATRQLDITKTEEEILAQMHPKGRYNIALAKKHGIQVEEGSVSDIDSFYELLQNTGSRDGFTISQKSHYTRFLSSVNQSFILLAKHEGRAIAGLIGVEWNGTTFYYYGASSYEHRNLMAPYILQWEAIRRAKAQGCTTYDLLGISAKHAATSDPWSGISDFKRKFGGVIVSYPPEQMVILKPIVKQIFEMKRKMLG